MNVEELIEMAFEDGYKEGIKIGTKKSAQIRIMKETIVMLRSTEKLSNDQILNRIKSFFTTDLSDEELKHLIITTK